MKVEAAKAEVVRAAAAGLEAAMAVLAVAREEAEAEEVVSSVLGRRQGIRWSAERG